VVTEPIVYSKPTGINRSQLGLDLDAAEPAAISRPAAIGTVDAFAQAPCPHVHSNILSVTPSGHAALTPSGHAAGGDSPHLAAGPPASIRRFLA
jgi:hypothetical protein